MNKPLMCRWSVFAVFSMVVLLLAGLEAKAQTGGSSSLNGRRAENAIVQRACCVEFSFADSRHSIVDGKRRPTNIDHAAREIQKAWAHAGAGLTHRESVVLIFRMQDGSYRGKLQHFTNEFYQATFRLDPDAVAIVHTHPNNTDPRPADPDIAIANKHQIPNFTITNRGMYVYDPATRKTIRVVRGLDWLQLSDYADEFSKWLEPGRSAQSRY